MLLPDVQTRLEAFGARGWQIGGVFTAYFLVQMLCSPAWGQLSDRIGRKPILIVCGLLSAGSMLVYALAHGLWWVLASRILAGFGGANVVVAQAYLADATDEPTSRGGNGAHGGGDHRRVLFSARLLAAGWQRRASNVLVGGVAASASVVGALWIMLSIPRDARPENKDKPRQKFFELSLLRDTPSIRPLFVVAALAFFVLACLEGTFGRLIRHKLGYGPKEFGLIFGYEALLSVVVQGALLEQDFASHCAVPAAAPGLFAARHWIGVHAVHAQSCLRSFWGQHPVCHWHGLCQSDPQHLMQRGHASAAPGRDVWAAAVHAGARFPDRPSAWRRAIRLAFRSPLSAGRPRVCWGRHGCRSELDRKQSQERLPASERTGRAE